MTRRLNRLQAALVIARRDYTATVFSRAFLFFLLGPLFPVVIGVLFGSLGARVADEGGPGRIAVIASPADIARLQQSRAGLVDLPSLGRLPEVHPAPPGMSAEALLQGTDKGFSAVLSDPFGRPTLTGKLTKGDDMAGQVRLLLAHARDERSQAPEIAIRTIGQTAATTRDAREITARAAQALLFLLTLLLSGMLLSQLIEEKSNKVIEVLAAAIPVESIFIGKLFAMLAMSLTGIAVWFSVALGFLMLFAPGVFAVLPAPAIGWPVFLLLGALYYAMSYLLIGAAFLGIGAQASTPREVQTLSMPVTMAQVGLLLLANYAITDPHGGTGVAAAAFPLSSPFAMIARGALDGTLWPHLAALAWQALWVGLILKLAAAWFRRSVLKSGGRRSRWWKRGGKPAEAAA